MRFKNVRMCCKSRVHKNNPTKISYPWNKTYLIFFHPITWYIINKIVRMNNIYVFIDCSALDWHITWYTCAFCNAKYHMLTIQSWKFLFIISSPSFAFLDSPFMLLFFCFTIKILNNLRFVSSLFKSSNGIPTPTC